MMLMPLLLSTSVVPLVLAAINLDAVIPVLVGVIWVGSWVMGQVRQSRKKNGGMRQTQVPTNRNPPLGTRSSGNPAASPTQQRIAEMRAARARAANAKGAVDRSAQAATKAAASPSAPARPAAAPPRGGQRPPRRPSPTQAARRRRPQPVQPARPVQPPPPRLVSPPARRAVHTDVGAGGTVAPCSLIESSAGTVATSVVGGRAHAVLGTLDRHALRRAILLQEVLGPPVALRPPSSQPGAGT